MHPQAEQESNFLMKLGRSNLVILACVLRATTKKGRQLLGEEKCTPGENPGYVYIYRTHVKKSTLPKRVCTYYLIESENITLIDINCNHDALNR